MPPPTRTQQHLLRATVLDGSAALAAWETWQAETQVPDLEPDSQWLLPALYQNLRRAGAAEARLGRYGYVYRHNWYKNHLLLEAARPILAALGPDGHARQGAALAATVYPALGARPIERLVLGCAAANTKVVQAAASAHGWRAEGAELTHPQGWRLSVQPATRLAAHTARVAGLSLQTPSVTEQLIEVLAERARGERRSALLWVVDAAQCLRYLGQVEQVQLRQCAQALGRASDEVEGALVGLAQAFALGDFMDEHLR